MRKPSEQRAGNYPSAANFFFLLYYSELFCFSELPCVGCTNPTDSRMGDDESLSKCRFFSPFFPFSTAEGVKSLCHAPLAGTSRAGAGRSSRPTRGVSARLCSPCPPWGCPSRASPAPHTPPAPGLLGLCPLCPQVCSGVCSHRAPLGHHSPAQPPLLPPRSCSPFI